MNNLTNTMVKMEDEQGYLGLIESFANLQKINESPPIYIVEDFLSVDECELLIRQGQPMLQRSTVLNGSMGRIIQDSRTSESSYLSREQSKWVHDRCAILLRKPTSDLEQAQVCRYKSGQFYRAHLDSFDPESPYGQEQLRNGGQRVATVLIYLNDVAEGGGTLFTKLGVRVLPQRGRAVVFFPSQLDGTVDTRMYHTAEDAVDEKWVCQVWVRQSKYT